MNTATLRKFAVVVIAAGVMGLTGCHSTDTEGGIDPTQPGGGPGANPGAGSCPPGSVLNGAQCTVTDLVDELAEVLAGTPLEGFVQCLDPTLNDPVEGLDALAQALLDALANQSADPAAVQDAAGALAAGIASLGENVPNLILALSGDADAIAACTGGGGGGGGGSSLPLDPTALCAVPTLGPAIVEAAGGACSGAPGGGGPDLSPAALCAVPSVGPVLAEAAGASCSGGGGGGGGGGTCVPGDPTGLLCVEQLCAIPTLGPMLVGAAGGTCSGGGGGGAPPLDPSVLCAIPTLGPILVEAAGGSCPGGGGGGGLPALPVP